MAFLQSGELREYIDEIGYVVSYVRENQGWQHKNARERRHTTQGTTHLAGRAWEKRVLARPAYKPWLTRMVTCRLLRMWLFTLSPGGGGY